MSRRPIFAVAVAAAGAALVTGCGTSVDGTATPPSSSSASSANLFQACGKIPDDAVRAAGADPSTAEENASGHQDGWQRCGWTANWFYLEAVATSHTMDEIEQNSLFHDFKQVNLPNRTGFTFLEGDDPQNPKCDLGFSTSNGSMLITVDTKGGVKPQDDPCVVALRSAGVLNQYLPQ